MFLPSAGSVVIKINFRRSIFTSSSSVQRRNTIKWLWHSQKISPVLLIQVYIIDLFLYLLKKKKKINHILHLSVDTSDFKWNYKTCLTKALAWIRWEVMDLHFFLHIFRHTEPGFEHGFIWMEHATWTGFPDRCQRMSLISEWILCACSLWDFRTIFCSDSLIFQQSSLPVEVSENTTI